MQDGSFLDEQLALRIGSAEILLVADVCDLRKILISKAALPRADRGPLSNHSASIVYLAHTFSTKLRHLSATFAT